MINYFSEKVNMPMFPHRKMSQWIKEVSKLHGKTAGNVSFIFCNDEKILEINQQYLQHDYFTDVITFDASVDNVIHGDIFISIDTVAGNALSYQVPFQQELYRIMIHGILHLCGFDDQTDVMRAVMRAEEDKALKMITF
ncbi:MAG: rRNA maturation RNase YbeY [Microbacter sp.]